MYIHVFESPYYTGVDKKYYIRRPRVSFFLRECRFRRRSRISVKFHPWYTKLAGESLIYTVGCMLNV